MSASLIKKPSAFQYALRWGLIVGAISLVYNTICAYTDQLGKNSFLWISYIATALVCFFLIKEYRNKHLRGYITFGKAFSICLQVFLYAGIFSIVLGTVMQRFFFPRQLERIQKINDQRITSDKTLTDEQIEFNLKISRTMTNNPAISITAGIITYAIMGSIAALIVAAVCKKESGEFLPDE